MLNPMHSIHNDSQVLDFPGGEELALKIYTDIVTPQTMDTIFYEAQRQGLYYFYVTLLNQTNIV
ncbi:hypothetical protein EJD97_017134 [Solanum chilense]|uniref:Uncharacterized protein n=1 Tax=Solanum chilense TaxID=4083 RepID=A0A6N2CAK9_SOLCI|nr:hypothetical protein EJD97_017134 [Solanum chilense]